MAKKKEVVEDATPSRLGEVLGRLEKMYGKRLVKSGLELVEQNRQVIPLSPNLDIALNGGIPEGCWIGLAAVPGVGKTGTAVSFCATAQKPEYGNRTIVYLDVENRLKKDILLGTKGLDLSPDRFIVISPERGFNPSCADYLKIGEDFLKTIPGVVLVIDSVSAFASPRLIDGGIGTSDYGNNNVLVGQFCDICAPVVRTNGSIVIGIVHMAANLSGYGSPLKEKIAKRLHHQCDIMLSARSMKPLKPGGSKDKEEDDGRPRIGQVITWSVGKCALGPPGAKCESILRYGVGLDEAGELLELGRAMGLVSGTGWMSFDFVDDEMKAGTSFEGKNEVKAQGFEKARQLLEDNPSWLTILKNKVKESL